MNVTRIVGNFKKKHRTTCGWISAYWMTLGYSANRKPTRFNSWRVFWLLRDMFSFGFSNHPCGSPCLFIRIVVILTVSFSVVLSEDLKTKRKSGKYACNAQLKFSVHMDLSDTYLPNCSFYISK